MAALRSFSPRPSQLPRAAVQPAPAFGQKWRTSPDRGLLPRARSGWPVVVLCTGYFLLGGASFAGDGSAPGQGEATVVADHAVDVLLHTVVRQIASGRIISPPDDNAMQTWQRVLQRDVATQRAPSVLKALDDFDGYARARAASERAAGRVLVAAELTVFADQASRMMGRIPPADQPDGAAAAGGTVRATATAADAATSGAPPAKADATSAAVTTTGGAAPAPVVAGNAVPQPPAAATAPTQTADQTAADAASASAPAPAASADAATAAETTSPGGSTGSAPQATKAAVQTAGAGGPSAQGSSAAATAVAQADASHAATPAPASAMTLRIAASAVGTDAATAAAAPASANGTDPGAVPYHGLADAMRPTAVRPEQPNAAATGAVTTASVHPTATPADGATSPAVAPSAAPESPIASFYAARGDAMLALKDISGARKFYEFAANAGSARAAAALARTYDAAFAAQLDEVGLQPDPELAAAWYRKAAELGAPSPQLSQSGDTGK